MGRERERNGNEFKFYLSCDINLPVTFPVEALHGNLPAAPAPDGLIGAWSSTPELFVECALFIDGVLFGLPTRISMRAEHQMRQLRSRWDNRAFCREMEGKVDKENGAC
ncbi:hypothetical protein M758_UG319200 [Ceratodon purpureus]|nr:hypothetical protein M758_UG319200 [Ceratodon purpureus]